MPALEKINDAIYKLSKIPEDKWITSRFSNGKGCCCAVGHLERLASPDPDDYSWDNCSDRAWSGEYRNPIREISLQYLKDVRDLRTIATVNNLPSLLYPQRNPKLRVLALLQDMKLDIESGKFKPNEPSQT